MNNKFGKDLTVGSIPRHLLSFSLPMLIANLLQTGYSIINTIWVGNIVGQDGVGATAVSFPVVFLLIAVASGATLATTILISQYYGAKDYDAVEKVVNNSFSIAVIFSVILTLAGVFSSDFLLHLMDTPENIFNMASGYLKITLAGFILTYIGLLIPSILRGIGDTMTPMVFMCIGVVINAILDPLLIIGIKPFPKLGLNGAAYASLIAQVLAIILALIYLNRKNHIVAVDPRKFILDRKLTLLILKIAFPSIIQQSLVSIGSAFITTFVNTFGAAATAAFGAGGRVDSVAFMPAISMGMAASALTGQNLGANKPERIKEIFKWGVIMTSVITVVISALAVGFPVLILTAFGFGNDPVSLSMGVNYLRIEGASYILFAIMFITNGIINGAGKTFTTMTFSLLSLWIFRVPLAAYLSHTKLGITGIWISIVISYGVTMLVSLIYYLSGRWKKTSLKLGTPITSSEPELH